MKNYMDCSECFCERCKRKEIEDKIYGYIEECKKKKQKSSVFHLRYVLIEFLDMVAKRSICKNLFRKSEFILRNISEVCNNLKRKGYTVDVEYSLNANATYAFQCSIRIGW